MYFCIMLLAAIAAGMVGETTDFISTIPAYLSLAFLSAAAGAGLISEIAAPVRISSVYSRTAFSLITVIAFYCVLDFGPQHLNDEDDGDGSCPSTCYGETCDYWAAEDGDSCAVTEWKYGCDCSGCTCLLDDATPSLDVMIGMAWTASLLACLFMCCLCCSPISYTRGV